MLYIITHWIKPHVKQHLMKQLVQTISSQICCSAAKIQPISHGYECSWHCAISKREEVTGRWGFTSALFVIRIMVIESSRIGAGHVTSTGEKCTKNFGVETWRKETTWKACVYEAAIKRNVQQTQYGWRGLDSSGSWQEQAKNCVSSALKQKTA
jgi:ABC-type polysaccharide transport system permease subunit